MEPVILFASPPKLDEMCGITVCVKAFPHMPLAAMQPQVIKCREMIFTEPDVMASPLSEIDSSFNMVLQQSLFKTSRIQNRLQKQGLEISKPYRVHHIMYQSTLHYTVLARLAPTWNKAGEWFIQGRDFLVHEGYANAVKINICVNREEIFLSLTGTVIRFPPLQVDDMNISKYKIKEILHSSGEDSIKEINCWCHVLPSMKRGKICSLSLALPKESPFSSYKDLKRHWKNMYGYRLPDTDENIFFCQVSFLPSGGGKHFTAVPAHIIQRVDPEPILSTFLQEFHSKIGSVCGDLLRFQPKILYTLPSLQGAGQESEHISLSTKPMKKSSAPLRNMVIKSVSHLYNGSQFEKINIKQNMFGQTENITTNADYQKTTSMEARSEAEAGTTMKDHSNNIAAQDCFEGIGANNNVNNDALNKANETSQHKYCSHYLQDSQLFLNGEKLVNVICTPGTKYVPVFRPKSQQKNVKQVSDQEITKTKAGHTVPIFRTKIQRPTLVHHATKKRISDQLTSVPCDDHKNCDGKTLSFTSAPLQPVLVKALQFGKKAPYKLTMESQTQAAALPILTRKIIPEKTVAQSQTLIGEKAAQKQSTKSFKSDMNYPKVSQTALEWKEDTSSDVKSTLTFNLSQKREGSDGSYVIDLLSTGTKRKRDSENGNPCKKPRVKPQRQNLDVESLARVNQLNKVNVVTLVAWLMEKGVACKLKDRKSDLMEKVNRNLNIVTQ